MKLTFKRKMRLDVLFTLKMTIKFYEKDYMDMMDYNNVSL